MSNLTDEITLLTTGLGWADGEKKPISTEIENLILSTSDHLQIVCYLITPGFTKYLDLISDLLYKGVKVTFIINKLCTQMKNTVNKIIEINSEFNHFYLYNFDSNEGILHAKIIVMDRKVAILGSANMTWSALTSNHEIAIKIIGKSPEKISRLIDKLVLDKRTKKVEKQC